MRLYVSGPVTGMPDRNADAFDAASSKLRDTGYATSVPTRLVDPRTDREPAMRCCITELLRCDGVALLPGWRRSKGACLEVAVATACGIDAMCVESWLERDGS